MKWVISPSSHCVESELYQKRRGEAREVSAGSTEHDLSCFIVLNGGKFRALKSWHSDWLVELQIARVALKRFNFFKNSSTTFSEGQFGTLIIPEANCLESNK